MTAFARKLAFSVATVCVFLSVGAVQADAKTTHHRHTTKSYHAQRAPKVKGSDSIRIAQDHLARLGYYMGKVDGKTGPQTKAATKSFQRDHGLKPDGILGAKTRAALEQADRRSVYLPAKSSAQYIGAGTASADVHPDYAASLGGGTKVVSSRFARLDVAESGESMNKRYLVNLNGVPVLTADGQPSVIGVSPTYDLGNEDVVIFTTYSPNDGGCVYRTHVLTMDSKGSQMLGIENCTRNYQARVDQGSLFINFPEPDTSRALGATWRVEGHTAQRM